jgi:hypothetical protein
MSYRDRLHLTYEAEWATFTSAKVNRPAPVADARAMIRRHLPGWKVTIPHEGSNAWCYCDARRIELGRRSPAWIVAHEIAHGLVDLAGEPPGHHDVFRHIYLEVVRDEVGAYYARKLRQEFTRRNLGVRAPGETRPSRLVVLVLRLLGRL